MKKNTLSKVVTLFFVLIMLMGTAWSQTVTIDARPAQVDVTDATAQSAVLVTLANYPTDDVRYRLYSGSTFHYVWDGTEFVTATSYGVNPLVPGTATTSTSWWILYEAGTNLTGVSNYRDRLGPEFSSNNLTQALPAATPIVAPIHIASADVAFAHSEYAVKHVVLAYDAEVDGALISATSTDLTTGDFTLVVEEGTTIQRIELRSVDNTLIESKTGVWPIEPVPFTTLFQAIPAYWNITGSTERGFAVDANNIYVASRNAGTFVKVHDRLTGAVTGDLNTTGITGGTFPLNDIEVSDDGIVIAGNLSQVTTAGQSSNFKLYTLTADQPASELINFVISFDTDGSRRLGDKFTLVGSLNDGSAVIYAADANSPRIFKWVMVENEGSFTFANEPSVINIPAGSNGSTPIVAPKPDGSFYYTASGKNLTKHNADGTLIGTVSEGLVATSSTAMKYIGADGNDEILAIYQNGSGNENIRVLRVINGDPTNALIEFITPTMSVNSNGNGTGDVAFVPNPAKVPGEVDLYVMGTNNGVGAYTSVGLNIEPPVYEILVPPVYARAQIIHNSADAAAASVDVFVNGALFYGGLDFREATPFVDVPAGVNLTIDIAPAGDGIGASVFNLANVQFTEDETYVIVASGIVSAAGYDPLTPFSLELFAGAREAAAVATDVDLLVYHGATDAPGVNVDARYVGNLVGNAEYSDFAGYLNVPAAYYTLDIAAFAAPDDILVSFGADLRALEGGAATVIASGFLDPSVNSNGAGFALLAVLADGTVVELPVAMDYEFDLSGLVEVPSNLSAGTGSGMLTLAGTVVQLSGSFSGLGSAYTMSHIHMAATGSNGGVAQGLTAELDIDELGGTYNPFVNTFDFSQENIDKLIAGELYVNIHSTGFPPGEIRGQILSSPNTAPTASAITVPADAAAITIEGDPATPFVPAWDASTDVDGDLVAYVWQLAADDAFTTILVNASTGTVTQFETDFETVDAILDGAGVAIGESITVYHRAISTDGSAITFGGTASVVLTRGEIAGFAITEFPWSETFEADSWSRPEWTQIQEVGTASWTFAAGSSGGSILTAYEGALNARFVSVSGTNSPVTKLVTPLLDLTSLTTPRVAFWYGQQDWLGDQNELKVYYRIAPDQPWVEIAHFTDNVSAWTKATIALPEPSATYQIALEGINNYGRANVIDLFTVEESPTLFNVTFNLVDGLSAPVTNAVVTLDGVTNAEGVYLFEELEPGTYDYSIMAPLFDPFEGEVIVADTDVTVNVTLIAGVPELAAEPETLNLGYAVNGITTTSAVVTITNEGYAPAEIVDGDITLAGTNAADFTFAMVDELLTYPISLENGESFEVEVTYTPVSAIVAEAQLVVASNALENLIIELMAVGYDPLTQFFDNFDEYSEGINTSPWSGFAETAGTGSFVDISTAGTQYSEPLHARIANGNNATGTVILISPMVTNLDASWVRFYARMGGSTQVENLEVGYITDPEDPTTFVPLDTVSVTGSYQQFVVSFADAVDPLPVNAYIAFSHMFGATFRIYNIDDVTYEPVPDSPRLSVNTDAVDFGDAVYIGQTVTQNIVVSNTGVGTLTLNEADFTITGADAANFNMIFTDDVSLPVALETAESYTLTVTFTPNAAVVYTATLEIDDNLVGKGITSVTLTGTGYDPTVTPEFVYDFIGVFPPLDWANLQGVFSDDTQLTPASFWVHGKFTNIAALPENNSARVNIYGTRDAWLVTPPIDLGDGTTPYMLSFDLALTAWNNSNPGALVNKQVAVVISTDNGETWSPANTLREWVDGDVISNTGQTEFIDLGAYSGIVKLGFYGKSWTGTGSSDVDVFVTNVAVEEAVYQTVTFNVTDAAAVAITDATVTLNGETLTAAPYEFASVAGTFAYEVSKDGYQMANGSVTVADMDVIVDVVLEELFVVDFTVTDFDMTALEGAEIAISGDATLMVTTDATGMASVQLENGTYQAVVSMIGYTEETIDIVVDGLSLTFDVELADMVADPFNLMVEVDGTDALFSWNNFDEPVLTESFEDGTMPEGWSQIITNTGTGTVGAYTWHVAETIVFSTSTVIPQDGDHQAFIMWSYNAQDEWLITPELEAPNGDLVFWYHGTNGSINGDNYYVKVSTDDGATWTALWNASDLPAGTNYYAVPAVVDLSAYAGQNIKIAWNNVDGDGQGLWYAWAIDNITIGGEPMDVKDLAYVSKANNPTNGINPLAKDGLYRERANVTDMVHQSAEKAFLGYTVFLNAAEVATNVMDTEYQFTGLPYGTHTAGVAANYSSGTSDTIYTDFTIQLPAVDALPMTLLYDATGENLPAEIGTEGTARAAALYQDRYVIVPSRTIGNQVWAFDMINPHLDPMALDMGTDLVVGGLFPVSYVEIVGDDIYVSNMSTSSTEASPFRVYRWSGLDAAPELVLSSDGGWGRLGDAFTIIGDPAANGSIVAHVNNDPGENALRRKFRKFDFVDGVIQNEDTPELVEVTLPDGVGTMNSYGVMKSIEGETDKFLVTSNAIGMAIVDGSGNTLAYIGTEVYPSRTMDANIFYHNGNRYLSFVVNKEWETLNGDFTAAYYQVVDITLGATVEEAISLISTPQDLINRTVHFAPIGDGSAFLGATNRVVKSGDDILILSHVVARGFKLVTSGAALEAYTLTVEAAPVEGGTVTGSGDFFEGATAPVSATPADGYQFVNWTVGGTEVSADAEFDYTMPGAATTLVANFETIPVIDVATLAELRALPADGTHYRYTGDAVIVAMDGFRNRKFLQDATAAIMIDDNAGTITTEYDLYDVITNVTGFTTVFRNLLQFVPLENTAESTVNTPVNPYIFTLDGVTQDDQAKLIKFENVTFSDLVADQQFANGANYNITDGTNTFVVRTDFWNTDLFETLVPTVPVNITGVLITFNETLQIVPRFAADIEVLYTLTLVANPVDGGTVSGEGSYAEGTVVTLDATAAEGYVFKDWTDSGGIVVSTDAGFDYTMPAEATTLTANFDIIDNVENLGVAFNIFPNPARDNFTIRSGATIRTLVISDITGKVVYNDVVNNSEVRIQNEFDTGIYILHIHTDEGVAVRKLQIQK